MEQVISFNRPAYETLKLPSNGIGHQGLVSIQVRPMTMKDEKILTNKTLMKGNKFQDAIFEAVVGKGLTKDGVEEDVNLERLLLEDEFALLLFVRAISYGRVYNTEVDCPTCGDTYNLTVDLEADVHIDYAEEGLPIERAINLPQCKKTVIIRYPERGDAEDSVHETIPNLITSVDGIEKILVPTWLEDILAGDFAELRIAANKAPFGVNRKVKLVCDNDDCKKEGKKQEVDLPITADFFRL